MNRRAFIVVLLFTGLLGACERLPTPTPIPPDATVVAFGDHRRP